MVTSAFIDYRKKEHLCLYVFNFTQIIKDFTLVTNDTATCIDHIYVRQTKNEFEVDIYMYSPYYSATDHDALLVTLHPSASKTDVS